MPQATTQVSTYKVTVNGKAFMVKIDDDNSVDIQTMDVKGCNKKHTAAKATDICAPLPATVVSILVREGQQVQEGDTVLVLGVMKMETQVVAPVAGTVKNIQTAVDQQVAVNQVLMTIA